MVGFDTQSMKVFAPDLYKAIKVLVETVLGPPGEPKRYYGDNYPTSEVYEAAKLLRTALGE